jgi:hypothetical protein
MMVMEVMTVMEVRGSSALPRRPESSKIAAAAPA